MIILTHRGLEPSKKDSPAESSYESFESQLQRGFGIEFDPFFDNDKIIVSHNPRLDLAGKGRIASLEEVLELIKKSKSKLNAMHLKGKFQEIFHLNLLVAHLNRYKDVLAKILIFDVKPEAAKYLKSKLPEIKLAPSVAHNFDIKRYNLVVHETLLSVEEAIEYKKEGLYNWVWLDEWDTLDKDGKEKLLYTKEVFNLLRKEGYKIALITPELHGTSPGLLGGESHKHALNKESLFKRIGEILSLKPDAVCTDYPEEVREMLEK